MPTSAPSPEAREAAGAATSRCRACGAGGVEPFHEARRVPVHSNELHASREAALARPAGVLRLGFCADCGFVENLAYDASLQDYGESYEDTQGHSARFETFASELVADLLERHALAGRRALEIGCGRGDFLLRLVEAGMAEGVGIDPAFRESEVSRRLGDRACFVTDAYSERTAHLDGDLVFCRHTLEHIADVGGFVGLLRANLGARRPVVYFEVPDTERILRERAFWDLYYEHCSYFTETSLARLFRDRGFAVERLRKGFGDQYLLLEARPLPSGADPGPPPAATPPGALAREVAAFRSEVARTVEGWRARLDAWRAEGRRVALWGAGSKAVGFLTAVEADDAVACVVDINPAKQGTFQAGTGHAIVSPDALRALRPDHVVMMNRIYADEIRRDLAARGLAPELHAL